MGEKFLTNYQLPITNYQLPITHHPSPIIRLTYQYSFGKAIFQKLFLARRQFLSQGR